MNEPKFLDRYSRIERNEISPAFKISNSISLEFNNDASLEDLWEVHTQGMEKYRKIIADPIPDEKQIDQGYNERSLLDLKILISERILEKCCFCERRCGVNRKKGQVGYCGLKYISKYASEFLHMGEEPELVPSHTIFFTGCVFSCIYCQNWTISTCPHCGAVIIPEDFGKIIDRRRNEGSKNVNFVTPTPHLHMVLKTLKHVNSSIPVIWNSNMYHSSESSKLLEGVVDVYLADFKYGNDKCASKLSNVRKYMLVIQRNFKNAYDNSEIILRHLVLPGHLECCTHPIAEWVSENIPYIRFNLMFQYTPHHRAHEAPEINRILTPDEKKRAIEIVSQQGIEDLLI
ncbi:radical SAM protein [Methanosalsum zhilinae]|nr:radical SAM protein [Methanosalsum zhilinae]